MIVKGFKTLAQLEEKLREIPEHKRKVIVLVGRHPNEGTINIAQRHHSSWEKVGAAIVKIPAEWTPRGFWSVVLRRRLSAARIKKMHAGILDDEALISFLSKGNFRSPVISFHGSPEGKMSQWDTWPVPNLCFYTFATNIHTHPEFEEPGAHMLNHPNAVAVEFYFEGEPNKGAALSRRAWKLTPHLPFLSSQLYPSYLEAKRANRTAINLFSERFAKEFEQVLIHLSRTGLKKR